MNEEVLQDPKYIELTNEMTVIAESHLQRYPRASAEIQQDEDKVVLDFYNSIYEKEGKSILNKIEKLTGLQYLRPDSLPQMPLKSPFTSETGRRCEIQEWVLWDTDGEKLVRPALRFHPKGDKWRNPWPKRYGFDKQGAAKTGNIVYSVVPQIVCTFDPPEFHKYLLKKFPLGYKEPGQPGYRKAIHPEAVEAQQFWKDRTVPEEAVDCNPGSKWRMKVLYLYLPHLNLDDNRRFAPIGQCYTKKSSCWTGMIDLPEEFYDIARDHSLLDEEMEECQARYVMEYHNPPEIVEVNGTIEKMIRKMMK